MLNTIAIDQVKTIHAFGGFAFTGITTDGFGIVYFTLVTNNSTFTAVIHIRLVAHAF